MPANLEHSAMAMGLEKVSFIPIPKKGNAKEWSNCHTIMLILHASKVMLKILQARLQHEPRISRFSEIGFWWGRRIRDQIASIHCIMKKARSFRKISTPVSLTLLKPLILWITINCGKFLGLGMPDHLTCLWETYMHVKNEELEWNNWLASKWRMSTSSLCIVTMII